MKLIKCLGVAAAGLAMVSCNQNGGVPNKALNTEIDSVSYAIGMDVARNIKTNASEVDKEIFMQGFMNAQDSASLKISEDQVQAILSKYFQKKQADARKKQEEEMIKNAEEKFADNKAEGEKFLEDNKSKEGIQVTDSGLQYEVLKEGTGEKPTPSSRVKVHYHGTLIDGTVFDSSVDRGNPTEFGVTQVIPGWTEGLQLMSVGSKYKFYIPQELAYGYRQSGPNIKPFSTLIFEVELLEIVK
ncbi:FKBP-type peptidyl-prolyl cis-trans isomerase [Aestuariibaculum sediminum]|uniref:Peptidyl-prolyl cis-trans isomerase n=1 Tax=Aestuariibaculum sediminum TaxID=2770637 RepID=A0A8J6QAL9_9FLAO|nr:FKBP-type peptidyl-prolyl cis-trans isomerase [Aestuariibaculum sediminum]MBD0833637.1 FKBP-type peptidyl-prolyl cis-trans isomerase [Aestuariibaculum sediminum]